MVVDVIVNFAFNLLDGLFSTVAFLSLPVDLVGVLTSFCSVGAWVIGADLLGLCMASLVFWYGIQFSVGFAIWIYKLIPFV